MSKNKIHDLPKIERPREKLMRYGPDKLTDYELLSIILRTGKKGLSVLEVSKKFFKEFEREEILKLRYSDIFKFPGIGSVKACEIIAVIELGKRLVLNKENVAYLSPKDVWNEMRDIRESRKEHFAVIFLDARYQEIRREIISIGTLNSSLVHPREVFEPAIRKSAVGIVLVHNHPSNDPSPSDADIEITKKLVKAGEILDIGIIDHVIVTKSSWFSFKQNGLIASNDSTG